MRSYALSLFVVLAGMWTTGCGKKDVDTVTAPLVVRVAQLQPADNDMWTASGTVRAQVESPLAFRVSGQIVSRAVSAGTRVKAGQPLMTLNPKDLREQLNTAEAQVNSARAEAENAVADYERAQKLSEEKFISAQALDRARTAANAAKQRVAAAEAQLRQANNAVGYTNLVAPAGGVLLEILAEPGQVVSAGQTVAVLAQDGPREAEVFIPLEHRASVSKQARVIVGDGQSVVNATLRELSAAADPTTRTWRARYKLDEKGGLELGTIVRLEFDQPKQAGQATSNVYRVPVSALSERGDGARIWVVADGKVAPQPVQVIRLDTEEAYVATALPAGTQIVAFGTHLLTAGQVVKAAAR